MAFSANKTNFFIGTGTTPIPYVTELSQPKGKRFASFVIGNTAAGHTADDVDILWDSAADAPTVRQALSALSASGGGKVLLLEGEYEAIGVGTGAVGLAIPPNITLEGMDANSTRISGLGNVGPFIFPHGGAVIKNLTIDNRGSSWSVLTSGNNNTVENCVVTSGTVEMNIGTGNRILNNRITGSFRISTTNNITDLIISGNIFTGAINILSPSSNRHRTNITGNIASSIIVQGQGNVVVGNTTVNGVTDSGSNNTIVGNGGI